MALRLQLRLLFNLSLVLFALPAAHAQSADDFFHGGAMFYLSNNIPSAKEVVTNGLQRFPDDAKLKKLLELLNQQQQSQSQQQQQQQNEQKQDEKKQDKQQKKDQQSQQDQKPQESKSDEKKPEERQEIAAHAMTPEEAKKLLDAQKGDEQMLQFRPPDKPDKPRRILKDW